MRRLALVLSVCLWPGLVLAQAPPTPTCEAQVQQATQQLITDQLLPAPGTGSTPTQQLTTLITEVRTLHTRLGIKRQQADLAETNIAQLLEQLRQAQARVHQLTQEVEALRKGAVSEPVSPPNN